MPTILNKGYGAEVYVSETAVVGIHQEQVEENVTVFFEPNEIPTLIMALARAHDQAKQMVSDAMLKYEAETKVARQIKK